MYSLVGVSLTTRFALMVSGFNVVFERDTFRFLFARLWLRMRTSAETGMQEGGRFCMRSILREERAAAPAVRSSAPPSTP